MKSIIIIGNVRSICSIGEGSPVAANRLEG
jgi:hypothetical protein